jgi:hypothetical protein
MQVRKLGQMGEPEYRVVFYFSLTTTVAGLRHPARRRVRALPFHTWHSGAAAAGDRHSALLAQMAMTRAYRLGKVLVVANLQYTGIVFSSLWGMLLWGDRFDWHVWLGMGVILAPASPRRSTIPSARRAAPSSKDRSHRQRTVRSPMYTTLIEPPPWPPTPTTQLGDRRLPPRPGQPGRRARSLCGRPPAERAVRRHGDRAVGRQARCERRLPRPPSAAGKGRLHRTAAQLGRERRHPGRGLRRPRRHVRGAPVVDAALGRPRSRGGARRRPAGLAGAGQPLVDRCSPARRTRRDRARARRW